MSDIKLNILGMEQNQSTLNKIVKLTVFDNLKAEYDNNNRTYLPDLKMGDIVQCEFIGIGTEYNGKHFAVVWSAPADSETIVVLPLTSQKIKEEIGRFHIGKIPNFITSIKPDPATGNYVVKDSYIYINKISEVSRTRVGLWYQRDNSGNLITDTSGHAVPVRLTDDQIERIKEGIHLLFIGGDCLLDILKKVHIMWIPMVPVNKTVLDHGYRRIISYSINTITDDDLEITYTISDGTYSMCFRKFDWNKFDNQKNYNRIRFRNNKIERRNELLRSLFSKSPDLIKEAEQIIKYIIV